MAERKVSIPIVADGKQAQSVIEKVSNSLAKLSKSAPLAGMAKLGSVASGLNAAFSLASKAIGMTVAALNECSEAYKEQAKAEVQLETAAKNNPYLNDSSVRALKNYASELQSMSTVGDEKLLPLMAQLASAGRTQAEIQSIMSAALDASASGAISLEAAVKGLNASYSGQVGTLGKILPQVKNLTAEELKQGKAVQLVAESYKGMAEETAKSVGASEQLKNAWGDFKENIGQGWEEATAPAKRELAGLLGQINDVNKRKKELKGAESNIESGNAGEVDYEIKLEEVTDRLRSAREELAAVQATIDSGAGDLGTAYALGEAQKKLEALTAEFVSYERVKGRTAKLAQEEAEAAEKARKEAEAQAAAEKAIADAKKRANDLATNALNAYKQSVEGAQREIDARRQLGETVSEIEEKRIMLAAKTSAYTQMIKSAQGAISGDLEREKNTREEIARLAKEIAEYEMSGEGLADKYSAKWTEETSWEDQKASLVEARDAIIEMQKALESDLGDMNDEKTVLMKKYRDAVLQINKEIAEGEKQSNDQRLEAFKQTFDLIGGYIQQTAQLIQQAMQFQLEAVQTEKESELASLEAAYKKGEISEEQYNAKKEQIEKEAAQKEYKIKMWEWAANIAQATANIAMAAVGAAAQTSGNAAARIIAMSLIGAAAGIQLASLIASKPVPPSFASGGIVQGNSWSGDNVRANVNSGEMILNAAQQKALWETANGRGSYGGGVNVTINNSAANIVTATPKISERQIELLIDARVKKSLADGKYNSALTQANQSMDGVFYGV